MFALTIATAFARRCSIWPALQHSRIAFVIGPLQLKSALARRVAFEESMQEIGLEVSPELLVIGDHTMGGGMNAVRKLAGLRLRPHRHHLFQ